MAHALELLRDRHQVGADAADGCQLLYGCRERGSRAGEYRTAVPGGWVPGSNRQLRTLAARVGASANLGAAAAHGRARRGRRAASGPGRDSPSIPTASRSWRWRPARTVSSSGPVRPLLRAHDRWIVAPREGRVRAASTSERREGSGRVRIRHRGSLRPGVGTASAAMLEELDRTGRAGCPRAAACPRPRARSACSSATRSRTPCGSRRTREHWRKILIHSLAIRREPLPRRRVVCPAVYGDFAPVAAWRSLCTPEVSDSCSARVRGSGTSTTAIWASSAPTSAASAAGRCATAARSPRRSLGAIWTRPWNGSSVSGTRAPAPCVRLRAAIVLRCPGTIREALRHAGVAVFGPRLSIARRPVSVRRGRGGGRSARATGSGPGGASGSSGA